MASSSLFYRQMEAREIKEVKEWREAEDEWVNEVEIWWPS